MPLWNTQPTGRPSVSLESQQQQQLQQQQYSRNASPEQTPLRRRENDAMSSPGHHYYAGSTTSTNGSGGGGGGGNYHTANSNTAELPRAWNHRGRTNNNKRNGLLRKSSTLMQWTMRGVLASPVLVLILWTVVAVVFHRNMNIEQQQQLQGSVMEKQTQTALGNAVPAVAANLFPVLGETENIYREFPAQGGAVYRDFQAQGGAVYREFPAEGGAVYREFQARGTAAENRDLPLEGATNAVYREFQAQGTAAENRDLPLEGSTTVYHAFQAQGTAAENRDLPLEGSTTVYRQFPAQGTGFIQRVENAGEGVLEVMEEALGTAGPPGTAAVTGKKRSPPTGAGIIPVIGPLGSSGRDSERLIVQPPPVVAAASPQSPPATGNTNTKTQNVQIYYYDPAQAALGSNGQWVVPSVVYDQTGRAVSTAALGAREILVEQPPLGVTPIRNSTGNSTTTTSSHPTVISGRHERSKSSTMNRLGSISSSAAAAISGQATDSGSSNTPLADQSIIIGTVGVMALLVGAITARRLRSRNILSACIENESLEDDIAYDTAYTINSDSYNTFSQGWKGDLEKFDV